MNSFILITRTYTKKNEQSSMSTASRYKGRVYNRSGRGIIVSSGITDHIQVQRPIKEKARIPDNLIAHRQKNRYTPFPINSANDFVCMQDDLLVRVVGEELMKSNVETNNYVIKTPCCSTPAGLTGHEKIQFLGPCIRKGSPDVASASGPEVTYLKSGLCSMLAHEEPINAGQMVIVDWPGVIKAGNETTPKSQVPNRNPKGRFVFVSRPLEYAMLVHQFIEIGKLVSDNANDDKIKEAVVNHSMYRHLPLYDNVKKVCPLAKYSDYLIQEDKVNYVAHEQARELDIAQEAYIGVGPLKKQRKFYIEPNVLPNAPKTPWATIFSNSIYPMQLFQEQLEMFNARLIGKAVTSALPGGQFEIEVGYRW